MAFYVDNVYSGPARLRLKKLAEASLRYFYGDTLISVLFVGRSQTFFSLVN
jgi:hypothetical protein